MNSAFKCKKTSETPCQNREFRAKGIVSLNSPFKCKKYSETPSQNPEFRA